MTRLFRLFHHLFGWLYTTKPKSVLPFKNIPLWIADLFFLIWDLLLVDKIFHFFQALLGFKKRELNDREHSILESIFESSIEYSKVRMYSDIGPFISRRAYAFVLFNTINYSKSIKDDVLVHEGVHIWQYQRYGSPYILRALLAQISKDKYDYGGIEKLYEGMLKGKQLKFFIDT